MAEIIKTDENKQVRRKRILVIDDDPLILMQMKTILREFYDVTVVADGNTAITFLDNHEVDLIFLDYVMPVVDGPTVYARLKENEKNKNIPVVFLSGVCERDTIVKIMTEYEPEGYMIKPATKMDLVCKVIEILG